MTHWLNGSVVITAWSVKPYRCENWLTRDASVRGVIRSTMLLGKVTFRSIQAARDASNAAAKDSTAVLAANPLSGRLSQDRTVNPGSPEARRRPNAATR